MTGHKSIQIALRYSGNTAPQAEQIAIEIYLNEKNLNLHILAPSVNQHQRPKWDSSLRYWTTRLFVFLFAHEENYTELVFGPHQHYLVSQYQGLHQRVAQPSISYSEGIQEHDFWQGYSSFPGSLILPPRPWHFNAYAIHGTGQERVSAGSPSKWRSRRFSSAGQFSTSAL